MQFQYVEKGVTKCKYYVHNNKLFKIENMLPKAIEPKDLPFELYEDGYTPLAELVIKRANSTTNAVMLDRTKTGITLL